MSEKTKQINVYCKLFTDLLIELGRLYPNDNSLKVLQMTVNGMILISSESFVIQVIDFLEPYSEKILAQDEQFFITELHSDFEDNSFVYDEIKRIHTIWIDPKTTDNTKKCIWKYFKNFIKLGQMIKK